LFFNQGTRGKTVLLAFQNIEQSNFTQLKQLFFPLLPALKTMGYWEVTELDRLAERV